MAHESAGMTEDGATSEAALVERAVNLLSTRLVRAFMQADELGIRVEYAGGEEDDEDWEDVMDDFDDPWMENPSPVEASELLTEEDKQLGQGQGGAGGGAEGEGGGYCSISWEQVQPMVADGSDGKLLVLDVRNADESPELGTDSPAPCFHNFPLPSLTKASATELLPETEWASTTVVVLDSGDHRSRQACVRLARVVGMPHVRHCDGTRSWRTP